MNRDAMRRRCEITVKNHPGTASATIRRKKMSGRSSDIKAETLGLPGIFFRRMVALAVPAWFFTVIWHLRRMASLVTEESVEAVDFYAGRLTMQRAFASEGKGALAFDKSYSESQDFCTGLGFLHSVILSLILRARGLSFWATVCSTWISMSRSSVHRSDEEPLGATRFECVRDANLMVSRMVLLIRSCLVSFASLVFSNRRHR